MQAPFLFPAITDRKQAVYGEITLLMASFPLGYLGILAMEKFEDRPMSPASIFANNW